METLYFGAFRNALFSCFHYEKIINISKCFGAIPIRYSGNMVLYNEHVIYVDLFIIQREGKTYGWFIHEYIYGNDFRR